MVNFNKISARPGIRYLIYPVAALILALLISILVKELWAAHGENEKTIVFTQLPAAQKIEKAGPLAKGMLRQAYGEKARLVLLRPNGKPEVLTGRFHSAADPEISFDGTKLLFSGKPKANDSWDVFEMNLDGTGVRQVTRDMGNCRNPIYLGELFTLDAKEPWRQVAFVSDLAGESNELVDSPATDLYACTVEGTELRRLTFNPSSDMDPAPLPDGRILYAAWQGATLSHGPLGRVSLLAVHTDGVDCAVFATDEGRRIKHMPAVTANGLVVFVESDKTTWDGAGNLAAVTLRRNLHSHRELTKEGEGLFISPSPLPDGQILVSRRDGTPRGTHGLYRFNPETGQSVLLYDDPKYHDIQGRAVSPRPQPDGHSSVVLENEPTGKIYCLSTNFTQEVEGGVLPGGKPARLRVLEGMPHRPPQTANSKQGVPEESQAGGSGIPALLQKRFLGEIDLEPDGSFNIQVPANIPIQFQLLDSHGVSLLTSDWVWAKNKENKGCIGCHEDYELAPPNVFAKAVTRASTQLTMPAEKRRTVDFRRDVMPIIATRCAIAACHGGSVQPLLDATINPTPEGAGRYNRSYAVLVAENPETPGFGRYVHPGRARTSPLIWHLLGKNMTESWDKVGKSGEQVKRMPPGNAAQLTQDEIRTVIEWVDLGALWDGIPGKDQFSESSSGSSYGGKR